MKSLSGPAGVSRALVAAILLGMVLAATTWTGAPRRAAAVEPYFCIELVLSRNWPAARFYCDSAATPGNVGIKLAEGIAYFFGAEKPEDVTRAARLWREVPPIADESEWRNISGVFDPEINSIEREAANLNRLAQYKLGVLHETGHFETPDLAAALFRYDQAARANLPEANIALARIYQKGVESIGVEADPVKAEQHLLKAISLRSPLERGPSQQPSAGGQAVAQAGAATGEELDELAAAMADAPDAPITASNEQAQDRAAAAAAGVAQPEGVTQPDDTPITASNEQAQDRAAAAAAETDVTQPAPTASGGAESAVASSAAASASTATPTGTQPSGSADSSSAVLAPEVLAALVAAAEDSTASEANAAASASAQAVPADSGQSSAVTTLPANEEPLPSAVEDDVVAAMPSDSEAVEAEPVPVSTAVPSSAGGGIKRSGIDERVVLLDPVRVPAETAEADASVEPEPSVAVEPQPSVAPAPVTGSSEGGRPGEGEGRWSPPAEVAALYYPEEELGESAAGETRDEEEIDIAAVAPQDVGAAAAGSASASASASSASAASASSSASASAGSSRLVTVEPFDRSELSCADTGATGATLAMPVVPDEEDTSGEEVQASASHVSDPGALIAIEQGIRAKASGDIDGALAAWTPYARHGNATAQYLVGMLYLTGDAVPRNLRTAYAWFGLAAGQGHQLATCELIRLEQRMSPEDVALAVEQARDLSSGSGQ